MKVRVNFVKPVRYFCEKEKRFIDNPKNEFFTDWIVGHHNECLKFEWEALPDVGEKIDLVTENGSEVLAMVKSRVWIPNLQVDLPKGAGADVYIEAEVLNLDDINGPLYDK